MGKIKKRQLRKAMIHLINGIMSVITVLSFVWMLRSSNFGLSRYEIDGVIYLITMSLIVILLGWYNQGRYAYAKKSNDYIRLLLLHFALSAGGSWESILLMRGQYARWELALEIVVSALNIMVTCCFGRFAANYFRTSPRLRRVYKAGNVAMAALTAFAVASPHTIAFLPFLNIIWFMFIGFFIVRFVHGGMPMQLSMVSYLLAGIPGLLLYYVTSRHGDTVWMPSLHNYFRFLSMLAIFCNVYVERSRIMLYQRSLLREKETEMIRNKLENMLLQINPHFLYNTLGSIKSLCSADPERAADLVQQLSEYLRSNYSDMAYQQMIPFHKELEYVRQYLQIEQFRFPNLKVEYDIKTDDFMIPSLSIQPLAENAVRHGIGQKRHNAGVLRISSQERAEAYEILIEDDGPGFDTSAGIKEDGSRHIEIANVRSRLLLACGGDLQIESHPGSGTKCRIILYKDSAGILREGDR